MPVTKSPRPGALNSTQRASVRLALATGATIVTLMGAQVLALQAQTTSDTTSQVESASNGVGQPISNIISTTTPGAPSTTNSGQSSKTTAVAPTVQSTQTTIQAAASQPRPRTRSSRG